MLVCVVSKNGERLMPTSRLGKVRHLLKEGKATIYCRKPFTIQLTYETSEYTQPIEMCVDSGYVHMGVSIKTEEKELFSEENILLLNEKERHDDCRKYRRTRRNRKRYRAPRFCNRRTPDGWFAPSIQNKADRQIDRIKQYAAVIPVTRVIIEVGAFDTQVIQAIQEGLPIPEGEDYQRGPRYGIDSLREAVFQRDHYTCLFCKRSIKDGAILHAHHLLFWRGQHGNRLNELGTVCERCHTPQNHKEGGLLWGVKKDLPRYTGAAFMNIVRWSIYNRVKDAIPDAKVSITYGAATKRARLDLGLEKTHCNDAFAMGSFHPVIRADQRTMQKKRRNNRILSKFYDAKYMDSRDGKTKKGAELFNGRISRNHNKDSENLHPYRAKKLSKGRVSTRKKRYSLQPGDLVVYHGVNYHVTGAHCNGTRVILKELAKSVSTTKLQPVYHTGGWLTIT